MAGLRVLKSPGKVTFELRLGERGVGSGVAIETLFGAGDFHPEEGVMEKWRGGGGINSGQRMAYARALRQEHAVSRGEGAIDLCTIQK